MRLHGEWTGPALPRWAGSAPILIPTVMLARVAGAGPALPIQAGSVPAYFAHPLAARRLSPTPQSHPQLLWPCAGRLLGPNRVRGLLVLLPVVLLLLALIARFAFPPLNNYILRLSANDVNRLRFVG